MSTISLTRLNKEYENLTKDPPDNFVAFPIKDDMFCWHFTIRGSDDSDFEGGLYHGVIKLPTAYPHKPPNVMFLTANGRYDTKMNICLSMTKYHKEEWQAAWTIRSMLEAIIAFMPIKEDHEAIGAIDTSSELRKRYATLSVNYVCDTCGPIANLLPPKLKPKQVIKDDKKIDKEKDDDEQTQSISSKKSKKKIDQHQRIGVIAEDSHEDDIEDENKLLRENNSYNQKEKHHRENHQKTIQNNNTQTNSTEKNKEIVNFLEFFKKMRTNQYDKKPSQEKEVDNTNNKIQPLIQKTNESQEDINIETIPNNSKEIQSTKRNNKISKDQKKEKKEMVSISNINPDDDKQQLNNEMDEKTQILLDELEFQHLMGTIKLYQTKSNEEIESIIKKECIEEKRKPKKMIKDDLQHCTDNLLTNQKELEKLLKSQVKNMKTYAKLLYEEGQKKRLRIMNCILTVAIISILIYFWVIKKEK